MNTNVFDHKLTDDVFIGSFAFTPMHCWAVWTRFGCWHSGARYI